MRITAKFNGKCASCGKPTAAGSEIEYVEKKAYHPGCEPQEGLSFSPDEAIALADRLGFRSYRDWDLLLLPPEANGDPAWWDRPAAPRRDAIWHVPPHSEGEE